ncbi:MAG: VOC family protein [Crocinitomicaceae bacterium]
MNSTKINYIELTASDLSLVKDFYSKAFGWTFTDYGSNYVAFSNAGIEGGFEKSDAPTNSNILVVLYHENLEEVYSTVQKCGGKIVQEIFSFPGGRRFQFTDPCGNELAIWSE